MTRDEVLREFGYCGWCEAGICSGDDNKTASHHMADEIVRLREELTGAQNTAIVALEAMRQLRERLASVEAERDRYKRLYMAFADMPNVVETEGEVGGCRCGKCASLGLEDVDLDSPAVAAEKEGNV